MDPELREYLDRMFGAIGNDLRRIEVRLFAGQLDALERRVTQLEQRMEKVEAGLVGVNARIDRLADDMRQRFRQVNDRLAELAA